MFLFDVAHHKLCIDIDAVADTMVLEVQLLIVTQTFNRQACIKCHVLSRQQAPNMAEIILFVRVPLPCHTEIFRLILTRIIVAQSLSLFNLAFKN